MILKSTKAAVLAMGFLLALSPTASAQTITFTQDDPTNWSDGMAEDGNGGSTNISGITLQIYQGANTTSNTQASGSTMIWRDATWFASSNGFTGITPGPDVPITLNGMASLIIKSSSPSVNFSLSGIRLLDWGGVPVKMITYDNGTLIGSLNLNLATTGEATTFNTTNGLAPATFGNIDELRIVPLNATDEAMWVGVNDIVLGAIPLSIDFLQFNAALNTDKTVALTWQTANSKHTTHFEIEQSFDGKNFKTLGTVAYQKLNDHTFNFTTAAIDCNAYFRIREIDASAKFTLSSVAFVSVSKRAGATTLVYPNPVKDVLHVQASQDLTSYSILDFAGKIIKSGTVTGRSVEIPVYHLLPGVYILNTAGAQYNKQHHFIKSE